ncbi:HupE/UreJ family protein [Arcicella sp. LKC2W]|uniref:HupE/UreJ family protein n=1 Tax=Arcicella sp. LKC2W TaxID=2984198 RepID=UPI002B21BB20|nr:HupE/UreJ family protein [Arcicella sp. LKC2W]MEA5460501.1 HupE/UreJ family protein [Arcicella sp. LKC2W]
MQNIKRLIFILSILTLGRNSFSHPMPNTLVVLNIHEKHISGEIQLPLSELQSAIGMAVNDNSERLIERLGDSLTLYLQKHIRPKTFDGKLWKVLIGNMKVVETTNELSGDYKELIVEFSMTPPPFYDLRNFYFNYDVVLHQVASHKILVSIKQDWQQGIISEDSTYQEVGVISLDVPTGKVFPFQISLQQGSVWNGFKNMVTLGIKHIADGTDHILFLLTLLLPAMLLVEDKKWGKFSGNKSSLINLLKIVTAFTIGHSLTLVLGTIQWLNFPSKPIEILIAITILISAFHAYKPIYPKKEILIAGGFGLIHGLAFAETLTNLQLSVKQLVISILGFNIGIELMQLFIILLVFPILILLSKTPYYQRIRQIGAIIMMILALAWMIERFQDKANFITQLIN